MNIKMRLYRFLTRPFRGHNLDRYPSLIRLHDYIVGKLSTSYIDVNGYKMTAGRGDWLHYQYTGEYEPLTTQLIQRYIHLGDVVVDVGANIGYYTLLFSRLVGITGKVYAFEPEPVNYSYLIKNIELNKYKNIMVEQKAVSDISGIVKLYLHETNPGGHTITSVYEGLRSIDVKSITLQDYFKDQKIDFVKIDVEGAEYLVMKGMMSFLDDGVTIVFEVNTQISNAGEIILRLLSEKGYYFIMVDEKEKIVKPLMYPLIVLSGKSVNILAIKKEKI